MKRRRFRIELTERQQMFLALLLVIMVAVSVLYCLGLASLALRRSLENGTQPWQEPTVLEEGSALRPFPRLAGVGLGMSAAGTALSLAPGW